jgi:phage baseplate assembly protein W
MIYYGYNAPFKGGHQNVMSAQSGDRLIKNDLLQLLLTAKGERLMRPQFGTTLKSRLFNEITPSVLTSIEAELNEVIRTQEPRINARVTVTADADEHTINIKVYGKYTSNPSESFTAEIDVPLATGTRNE